MDGPSLQDFMPGSSAEGAVAIAGTARPGLKPVAGEDIVAAIKMVQDPEIPVDIYELGLIYRIDLQDNGDVAVDMTLTAPACPVAGEIPQWVADAVATVPDIGQVSVKLTFDPPWTKDRMSDEAMLELDLF